MGERQLEDRLLLASAGTAGAAGTSAIAGAAGDPGRNALPGSLLQAGIDWERLFTDGLRHGLLPLLHRHLDRAFPGRVPPAFRERLRRHYETNQRRNLFLSGELYRVLEVLGSSGVAGVPLRGIALAASAYEDLALRQFTDLDLLVREEDVHRASRALGALGYRPAHAAAAPFPAALLRRESELLLARADQRIFLELHWRLAPPYFAFDIDPGPLWERVGRAGGKGGDLPALSPEDTLLVLCLHGSKHLWERLIWLADVSRYLALHPGLAWGKMLEEARAGGAERVVLLGLCLARDLLGAALSAEVGERLERDGAVRRLSGEVEAGLFGRRERPDPRRRFLFHLAMRERYRDRLRYALRLARRIAPGDRALLPLPRPLSPLHGLVRSVRLAGRYALWPLVRSSHDKST